MPSISGTLLTYIERCSATLKKVFLLKKKVPKIKENIQNKGETMKKCHMVCLCHFVEASLLPQSDLNQVKTSPVSGDSNLRCTAAAKCNNLYETFIFLY